MHDRSWSFVVVRSLSFVIVRAWSFVIVRAWSCVALALAIINIQTEIVNGERFFFNRFPRDHYLVSWVRVRVRVSLGVKVRVSVDEAILIK